MKIGLFFVLGFGLLSLVFYMRWTVFGMVDVGMWAGQAEFVVDKNPNVFDFLGAYGHPGGTVIIGTALIHLVSGLSYFKSLYVFLSLICSILVVLTCRFCYLFLPKQTWWLCVGIILSLNRTYELATPPSILAAFLTVLIFLTVLKIANRLVLYGILLGLLLATRFDIGLVVGFVTICMTMAIVGWRRMIFPLCLMLGTFFVFDPFMWFMPLQHVQDLIFKMFYHYVGYSQVVRLSPSEIIDVSKIALLSICLSIIGRRMDSPFSKVFMNGLYSLTVASYVVFLTARFQSVRYLLPVNLIWEVLLPIWLFRLLNTNKRVYLFVLSLYALELVGSFAQWRYFI